MPHRLLLLLPMLLAAAAVQGQGGTICPGLTGPPLLACLRAGYARTTVVGYDQARSFLYTQFYPDADPATAGMQYRCVYTGRTGPLGGGGSTTALDTEHTWPRSMMTAEGAQEGEMHNLFPTISRANNDRGNLPFGEVDDAQTMAWYGPTGPIPQTTAPGPDHDAFSERLTNVRFEPREDHEGNVARTLAYFYTFYGTASAAFWQAQQPLLTAWNRADPPDSSEVRRSAFIRTKQGNDNPFILDTTLIRRAFSAPVAAEPVAPAVLAFTLAPSPARDAVTLTGTLPGPARLVVTVYDALGRRRLVRPAEDVAGAFTRTLDVSGLAPGLYVVHAAPFSPRSFVRTR